MSRDDPVPSHHVSLGPCDCPASPHDEDYAMVRDKHDYAGMEVLASMNDDGKFLLRIVTRGITEWNLVGNMPKIGEKGEVETIIAPLPITWANVDRLAARQQLLLLADIQGGAPQFQVVQIPKEPGEQSADGLATNRASRRSKKRSAIQS